MAFYIVQAITDSCVWSLDYFVMMQQKHLCPYSRNIALAENYIPFKYCLHTVGTCLINRFNTGNSTFNLLYIR